MKEYEFNFQLIQRIKHLNIDIFVIFVNPK